MVRMENPSPIQVGREFVRQYYTLLNKAPEMLHRFYGVNSSYVHGSRYCDGEPEEGVTGQMAIHKKITSLEFKECHTKVRQVDAHSTIGSGVVVQVIGELSNDRKPLRRFMQTFVLAPQGENPYKFYVHNDIFRYEDEVFQDEVSQDRLEEGQESEEEEGLQQSQPPSGQYDNHSSFYQPQAPQIISNGIEQRLEPQSTPSEPRQASPTPVTSAPTSPTSGTQSYEHAQEPPHSPTPDPESKQSTESPIYSPSSGGDEDHIQADPAPSEPPEISSGAAPATSSSSVPESEPPSQTTFSWAALASKNTPMQHNTQQGTVVKANQSDQPSQGESLPQRSQNRGQKGATRPAFREDNDRGSGDRGGDGNARRAVRYPDNQQIFVGNLPYDITDTDLRKHFAVFGQILDIRINHSHTSNPSFGFIIFEDQKSVEEVLRQMPTTFKDNKRINIEEKKQRTLPRDGRRGGPGGMDGRRDNPRGGNRAQQRGPPRRDRGGSREGQRPGNFSGRR